MRYRRRWRMAEDRQRVCVSVCATAGPTATHSYIRADKIIAKFDSYLAKWCGVVRRVRLCSHKQRFVSFSYQLEVGR